MARLFYCTVVNGNEVCHRIPHAVNRDELLWLRDKRVKPETIKDLNALSTVIAAAQYMNPGLRASFEKTVQSAVSEMQLPKEVTVEIAQR